MKKILLYFIQGIIITVPVAITAFVLYKIFSLVVSFFAHFGVIVNPVIDPFIEIVSAVILIFLMGLLG
ncbi:MAG: hypothetical protein ACXVP4_08170, partial [Bacteroidia bacterium]